jgi:hypothetical protein
MSLDFKLIEDAVTYTKIQIESMDGKQELYYLTNFIYPPLVNKLVTYVHSSDNWITDPSYSNPRRTKINWESDTVVEEVHTVFERLTDVINNKFSRTNNFLGVNIWKDTAGYAIGLHKDVKIIDIAVQVYLSNGPAELGTEFVHNGVTERAQYKLNCGYLADNKVGISHALKYPVPESHTRYSIYGIWTADSKSE